MRHLRIKPGTDSGPLQDFYQYTHAVSVSVIDYAAGHCHELRLVAAQDLVHHLHTDSVTWINVDGIHNQALVTEVCDMLNLHSITQEDILNADFRPKIEEHTDYIQCSLKMISHDSAASTLDVEQMTVILGKGFVLTFQENPGDVLEGLRERIRGNLGRVRRMQADYLFYRIIETVISHYPVVVNYVEDSTAYLEEAVTRQQTGDLLMEIQHHKKLLQVFRRYVEPLREILLVMARSEHPLVHNKTLVFFRDLNMEYLHVMESVDSLRDTLHNLQDFHLSLTSHRMNEVMKVLTVFSAIFMPLTFIAGIYGMNFHDDISPWNMPELHWYLGYPLALLMMAGVGIAMFFYFKKKGWLQ